MNGQVSTFMAIRDYRGSDMVMVRRITAVAAFVSALVIAALAPVSPPVMPIGEAGWALVALAAGALLLVGLRLQRADELRPGTALAVHVAALPLIALVIWVTDGPQSPYTSLYLIWMVLVGASHPPRRTVAVVALAAGLATLPLVYAGWSGIFAGDLALRLAIWSVLALLACVWLTQVRIQRADLMEDEEEAKRQARADALTGLGNRRAFDERLNRAIERAKASGAPLSVIVSDLDGFKQINDSYGHVNGDEVLRDAANAIRAALRDRDACYRWGGDEFVVLLPGLEQAAAEKVAERVAASVVALCTRPDGDPQTLAWGSAALSPEMDASDLLASADLALMTRKHTRQRGGRFSVEAPEADA